MYKKVSFTQLLINGLLILALSLSMTSSAIAQGQPDRQLPDSISELKLPEPFEVKDAQAVMKIESSLLFAQGLQQVSIRLSEPEVAQVAAQTKNRGEQQRQLARVKAQQEEITARAVTFDTNVRVLGKAQKALNVLMLEVDASTLRALAENPAVLSISKIKDYELDLYETVPYIGAAAVQNLGYDGSGVRVAVLDSGVDYLHWNLGGSGDPDEFAANDPTIIEEGTFPTEKVVGGYDFVGDEWPNGPLLPDPDPIDSGPGGGHGTHVADIIAGKSMDGLHVGVAPNASLYALKVCSSVSTSCSGVALIQAMDFILDPDGDGDLSDRVDMINMSLGSVYGQAYDDDLSAAVENVAALGVLTVASAGNSADKPYVTGSPGASPSALSVAQTNVPSALQPLMEILSPPAIEGLYPAVHQPWSPYPEAVIEAPVQYGDGMGGNLDGCAPFAPGTLNEMIVLVDRGGCNFTLKIKYIAEAGGVAGIIGLVAPGDPFAGGDGGDRPIDIPGYMISQAISNLIKNQLGMGVVIRFDPATGIPLVMHMVGSSSRGPTMLSNIIKPEIGAPGASVSAIAGSGTGVGPFGGTSGAAPMVTGSAALLKQAFPGRSLYELKAVLMNTAETQIMNVPAFFSGDLAAISRIGGGEVRVDRALASPAAAWDAQGLTGALSFGFHDVPNNNLVLQRSVVVKNYSGATIHYNITPTFRFMNDVENGAVKVVTPAAIVIPAYATREFKVNLQIEGAKLRSWTLNSGSAGANGDLLSLLEYDGYLKLTEAGNPNNQLNLAWHVLPRRAGDVSLSALGKDKIRARNNGAGETWVEAYSLIAVSENLPQGGMGEQNPTPDFRYFGYATYPVPAGYCSPNPSFLLAFAANTWERQTHANAPNSFEYYLDTNQDGIWDYIVMNRDVSFGGLTDGRNLSWVYNLATNAAGAFFFTDHQTNSGNTVLLICGEQIGMNAANFLTPIDVLAFTNDVYFGGDGDILSGITIAPMGERYLGIFEKGGLGSTLLDPRTNDILSVLDTGSTLNNTETGLLLLYRDGAPLGNEAGAIVIQPPSQKIIFSAVIDDEEPIRLYLPQIQGK